MPIECPVVGIEGVDTVVLCGGEDHVARSAAGDRKRRDIQRLRIHFPIHGNLEELAEAGSRDVLRSQNCFRQVLPGTEVIVVITEHVDLRKRAQGRYAGRRWRSARRADPGG